MKKLVKEDLYRDPTPGEIRLARVMLDMKSGVYDKKTFSEDEVRKILKSIIGYTKEPGRMCGNLDDKIKTLAKKHGIKL
jgi:hypothetical protein